jgi:hypothetical protein
MIEEYRFGSITINGKTYNHDVEVLWTDEVVEWWREESHVIYLEDIEEAVALNPDTIIIGTGESGVAQVDEKTRKFIIEKGIKLIIDKTEDAVKTFNVIRDDSEEEEGEQNKVIGFFHLTC